MESHKHLDFNIICIAFVLDIPSFHSFILFPNKEATDFNINWFHLN